MQFKLLKTCLFSHGENFCYLRELLKLTKISPFTIIKIRQEWEKIAKTTPLAKKKCLK